MDEELRTLKRRAETTYDIMDEVAYLRAKLRVFPGNFLISNAMGTISQAVADCHTTSGTTIAEETIDSVIYTESGCNCGKNENMCKSYCDTYSWCIVRLKDGKYGVASESSDTSGHG
jgi:hypothetical protein